MDSVISEAHPLWKLENQVLENKLSLFGVKPQQLEQQINDYRKKHALYDGCCAYLPGLIAR